MLEGCKEPYFEIQHCYLSVQARERMGAGKASVATHVRLIKLSVAEVVDVNTREEGVTVKKTLTTIAIQGTAVFSTIDECPEEKKLQTQHFMFPY